MLLYVLKNIPYLAYSMLYINYRCSRHDQRQIHVEVKFLSPGFVPDMDCNVREASKLDSSVG